MKYMNFILLQTIRRTLAYLFVLIVFQYIAAQEIANSDRQASTNVSTNKAIVLTVTVTDDRGAYVTGLTRKNFTVFDDKLPQEITSFVRNDVPLNVGILFDLSGSMNSFSDDISNDIFEGFKKGLARFIEISHKDNEYFLFGIKKAPILLSDYTRDGNSLLDKIHSLELRGATALYDACYLGIEKSLLGVNSKRVVLLISDGQDSSSQYQLEELKHLLKETDALLYVINLSGISGKPLYDVAIIRHKIMQEISEIGGGTAFIPRRVEQIKDVFEIIAVELRHQYTIGFQPARPQKIGEWHSIHVKATAPANNPRIKRLRVRSRTGYYTGIDLR